MLLLPDTCKEKPVITQEQIQKCSACRNASEKKRWCGKFGFSLEMTFEPFCRTCPAEPSFYRETTCGKKLCLTMGIKPDGKRVNLKEWWQSGGACPLGHWPSVEER